MQEASLLFSFPDLVRCHHIYFLSHPGPTQLALPSLTTSVEPPQALRGDLALKDPLRLPLLATEDPRGERVIVY